jgi:uncharacterized membrane protein YdjX (TVP38/TMEM64 family)
MSLPSALLRRTIHQADLLSSVRAGMAVVVLFALGMLAARHWGDAMAAVAPAHERLAMVLFVLTSVVAVLLPMLSNLPLVPFAALAWGPWWTAGLLLGGWIVGATLSFVLGRRIGDIILRRFPSVRRHADIDRLIHPRHRLLSLVMLRMTFPVDVLSYALGLFSRTTRAWDVALSTALGGAPFAVGFAFVPVMPPGTQAIVIIGSVLVFVAYARWILRHPPAPNGPV